MKKGVICLGEALIDFIPMDDTNMTYHKSPGGAPANVSVGLARLGARSTFIGKVGNDVLGRFLMETLADYGVDISSMRLTRQARTGATFVTLGEHGERSFEFYIDPSADRFLEHTEVTHSLFETHRIFHFGSISLICEPAKSATIYAAQTARKQGMIVSYDPNLRLALWDEEEQARETIISMLSEVDVLKLSEEELTFITGQLDIEQGVQQLREYDIPLIFITLGEEGSMVFTQEGTVQVPALKVNAIDTTGAGDAFVSGYLYGLNELKEDIHTVRLERVTKMAHFASVSGALAASKKGAMTALPTLKQVQSYLSHCSSS